jgi:hypothetical protein
MNDGMVFITTRDQLVLELLAEPDENQANPQLEPIRSEKS